MVRELNEILRDTVAIAEEQVEAARNLDVAALTEATGCREHLLDELNQAMEGRRSQASAALSEETEGLVFQLADLDARLETLLGAGLSTIEKLRGSRKPDTYTFEGRLKESTP